MHSNVVLKKWLFWVWSCGFVSLISFSATKKIDLRNYWFAIFLVTGSGKLTKQLSIGTSDSY